MSETTTPSAAMTSGDALRALYRTLSPRRRRQAWAMTGLMLVGGLAEVVSMVDPAILRGAEDITIVVIAHRLTTLKVCERVIHLEHGRINRVVDSTGGLIKGAAHGPR